MVSNATSASSCTSADEETSWSDPSSARAASPALLSISPAIRASMVGAAMMRHAVTGSAMVGRVLPHDLPRDVLDLHPLGRTTRCCPGRRSRRASEQQHRVAGRSPGRTQIMRPLPHDLTSPEMLQFPRHEFPSVILIGGLGDHSIQRGLAGAAAV